jgi:hypothetical protein
LEEQPVDIDIALEGMTGLDFSGKYAELIAEKKLMAAEKQRKKGKKKGEGTMLSPWYAVLFMQLLILLVSMALLLLPMTCLFSSPHQM